MGKVGRPIKVVGSKVEMLKRKKKASRNLLYYYVKTGQLERRPCEYADCINERTEAHHPDYWRPLDVLWLCRSHHLELHQHMHSDVKPLDQYDLAL